MNIDEKYYDEMIKMYKEFIIDKKMWPETFCANHGALVLDTNGKIKTVVAEYPKLMIINKKGETVSEDYGGNLERIKKAKDGLLETKTVESAWIEYFPKFYSYFLLAQKYFKDKQYDKPASA